MIQRETFPVWTLIRHSLPLILIITVSPLAADDSCLVPMDQWQPRQAVQEMIEAHGWVARHIKIDDGCYEVHARDSEGRSIEIKVDPGTLAIFYTEYELDE